MFTKVELYTIDLKLDSSDQILGSPVTDIKVVVGDVQAEYSELINMLSEITAGNTHTW
jgi:tRNA (Thr-GGU) A37 N-methylase